MSRLVILVGVFTLIATVAGLAQASNEDSASGELQRQLDEMRSQMAKMQNRIAALEASRGTVATSPLWNESKSRIANNGPRKAPRLSPIPSKPKARPLYSFETEDAIRASRGGERKPAPKRSRKRPPYTLGHAVAIPIRALPKADTK